MIHLALLSLLLVQQTATSPRPAVQVGVTIQPETVTVGQRFTLVVRVRAAAHAVIEFPAGSDTGAALETIGPPRFTEPLSDTIRVEQLAGYRLAAWDVGSQPLRFGEIVVRVGAAERRISLRRYSVFVRSVLPADTTLHVPKPARPLIIWAIPRWLLWLLALIAAALALVAAWWIWRYLRRRRQQPLDPAEHAAREFTRIEAMRLPDRDEGARHVALMTDVLRVYFTARVAVVQQSQTSAELLSALRRSDEAPLDGPLLARVERLLARADLAKFAALRIGPEDARTLGAEARAIVIDVEQRLQAPEEKAAA